jgi:glycosyltransferase involved in cell wall biosynthesis
MVRTRHISAPVGQNAPTRWLYTRGTARIVTTGEALKKELIERNGFPAARIDSVPTGIDAGRFRPGNAASARAALGLPVEGLLVGIVATLRDWKGHEYLIEALAGLKDANLLIVGDGPRRQILENFVDAQNMRARTTFAGDQADVVPWLHALDIFVLPSFANEGVPQALIQAMLTGLPCVTTHAGSIAELARHDETALVVPVKDAAALRVALQRLIADPALRKTLGDAARRHCAANYSYQGMLDRMEQIYRQVLR